MGAPDLKNAVNAAVNPKYRLDRNDTVKTSDGTRLYRIIALRSFGDVEEGQRGGYIEGEHNLSHEGNCWVAGLARVMKRGRASKNALVCDFAEVTDDAEATDDTLVNGHGYVGGKARIFDNGEVGGRARVIGAAEMSGNSRAGGEALVSGRSILTDDAFIHGTCVVSGTAYFGGNSDLDGGTWPGRNSAELVLSSIRPSGHVYDC